MNLLFLSPSGGELILVLFIVLLLFGANKIPGLARGLGKGIREIKNATGDIQREIQSSMSEDIKKVKEVKDKIDITKDLNS